MDHAHSQPSDALRFIGVLRRAINNPQKAAAVLEQDSHLWDGLKRFVERINAPADQPPSCKQMDIPTRTEQERLREELGNYLFDTSTSDEKKHLREAFEEFLALFETPKQPPLDDKRATVDNPPSDSTEIDPISPPDRHDSNAAESDCSAITVLPPSLRANLPRCFVPPTPMNGRKKGALVIESNGVLSRMFKTFLESDHYLVRTANQSEDAHRLYRDCGPFKVVLIDYHMPKKNGIDIALDILKQDPTQAMMIIATDYQSEDEVPRRKELMNIPFLLDVSNFRKTLAKLQPWATTEEVYQAITSLTTVELLRLRRFAERRTHLSRGADARTWEEVLQEALTSTLKGAEAGGTGKRYRKNIAFVTHLFQAIRNITGRRKNDNIVLACDTIEEDAEGQEYCQFDDVTARERNDTFGYSSDGDDTAEDRVIAEEIFNRLLECFKDIPEDRSVLQCLSEGLTTKQIVRKLGLSESQCRVAVKRIGRRMKQIMQELGLSENQHPEVVKLVARKLLSLQNGADRGGKNDGQN